MGGITAVEYRAGSRTQQRGTCSSWSHSSAVQASPLLTCGAPPSLASSAPIQVQKRGGARGKGQARQAGAPGAPHGRRPSRRPPQRGLLAQRGGWGAGIQGLQQSPMRTKKTSIQQQSCHTQAAVPTAASCLQAVPSQPKRKGRHPPESWPPHQRQTGSAQWQGCRPRRPAGQRRVWPAPPAPREPRGPAAAPPLQGRREEAGSSDHETSPCHAAPAFKDRQLDQVCLPCGCRQRSPVQDGSSVCLP